MNPNELPVYREKERILAAIEENQVVVVESPTGSGKTTQLPLILHEAGYSSTGVIGITQPRRIATLSVCEYIAAQLNTKVPGLAGYKMRFEDMTLPETKIKVMTDGILLQELKNDTLLSKYSVILVDEAHERSLNIDFILGLLKNILEVRSDFKVIISSATINTDIFSEYFNSCPVVHIVTRVFPVQIIYDPVPESADRNLLLTKITQIVKRCEENENEGDILIFLSGEKDIKDCVSLLELLPLEKKLFIVPLYGRLSKEEQEKVFIPTPPGQVKVVISTNIAETSVTINGVTVVIDSGLVKLNHYNPRTFTSSLIETGISKASANQRKGRAGRTQPGTCYRLCTRKDYDNRALFTTEEIYRTDLSEVVLRMAEIGIKEYEAFDFISPPGKQGIHGAVATLHLLGALNDEGLLSSTGTMMARFPLLPRHSRMIVEAIVQYPDVIEETIIATAFLSAHTPFILPQGEEMAARKAHHHFQNPLGDFVSYLKLFKSFTSSTKKQKFCESHYLDLKVMNELVNIKEQLEEIVSSMGVPIGNGGRMEDYLCAVSRGLIQFVCVRSGNGVFRSLTAEQIRIHPGSVMFRENPRYIVAGEIVKTSRMFARSVSPLEKSWLKKISPEMAEGFLPAAAPSKKGKNKEPRDTSWQFKLGVHSFELKPFKNKKKIAILPWPKLKMALKDLSSFQPESHSRMKGVVTYKDYEFLRGVRLPMILAIMEDTDPERDLIQSGIPSSGFRSDGQFDELCEHLPKLLKLSPLRKNGREGKQLGFIGLEGDDRGQFWFRINRSWSSALENSLSNLEVLIDGIAIDGGDGVKKGSIDKMNTTYRRLTDLLDD
ncbi:MAG: ATP-dependent RNA helicase [Spirochaetales bacterium]|nr:ATP-dependent RNA helicase [Spirochaetales bacterium]